MLEQLAGDELDDAGRDSIIATGFYRLGVWNDEPDDKRAAEYDGLDDMVVAIGASFMGLTVGCARCHDHMYDAIPQKDYYSFLAFLQLLDQGVVLKLSCKSSLKRCLSV